MSNPYLTKVFHFNAAHQYGHSDWTDEKNWEVFVEVEWFKDRQPSSENLVIFIWNQIQSELKGAKLHRIRLHETPTIFTDYYG